MPRICPQCNQANQEDTMFCRFCGFRFEPDTNDATIHQDSLASVPANADPSATLKTGDQGAQVAQQPTSAMPMQTPQPQAAASGYPPLATPNPAQPQGPLMGQPTPQGAYPMQAPYGQAPSPYGTPVMAQAPGAGMTILERAFAGKGTPVHHQSWLLDGNQAQPATLRDALINNLQRQGVMGITATPERLREHSTVKEERDYVRVQYGTSAVFVYMAPMGQNLYVSRTSTVQQPFSRTRMIVLGALLVLMVICWLLSGLINPSSVDTIAFTDGLKTFFGYAFFGLLFFFLFLLIRSIVFALTDKDFLAYLRPNRLNDFTLDALSSVEKVTDKAVRETLKQAGLNADEITQPAQSYALQQPLHQF